MTRLTAAAEAAVFLFPNDLLKRHRPAFLDLAAVDRQRKGDGRQCAPAPLFLRMQMAFAQGRGGSF